MSDILSKKEWEKIQRSLKYRGNVFSGGTRQLYISLSLATIDAFATHSKAPTSSKEAERQRAATKLLIEKGWLVSPETEDDK